MAQGAVKKNGKRSQAVSAKKEAILAAALEAFSQFGIHGTRLEQVRPGNQREICTAPT